FYSGDLQASEAVAKHTLFAGDKPVVFIDTAGCGFEEKQEGGGISNAEEANAMLQHLATYLQQMAGESDGKISFSIGIISPYRHQVAWLKEQVLSHPQLQAFLPNTTVNTIDSFQGQERDIVYISLTRSNADNVIGFLSEIRRMNVAMTRARNKLVVIGDSATIAQFPFYADFIEYVEQAGGYMSAWELMGD
ncbi:MAG: C-terminal helicase domain-containing protein, partial [Chitinophagaceae bacterium]|nr:C-terminal helicase domain-containing protein [Chitinophagaceae bacterium]